MIGFICIVKFPSVFAPILIDETFQCRQHGLFVCVQNTYGHMRTLFAVSARKKPSIEDSVDSEKLQDFFYIS